MDVADIRIKEHFGLVTNDTNTTQFSFLISPPKNRETIEKNDIICFNHPKHGEACQVLAKVTEITSYEEVAGSTMGERAGKMLATAKILGYIDLRRDEHPLRSLLAPPNPGSRIYVPYASFLEDTFNRRADGTLQAQPLPLGQTEILAVTKEAGDRQVSCFLDAADLTSKHTLICGAEGTGKTHLTRTIVRELAAKTSRPIAILDPHGEYSNFQSSQQAGKTFAFQADPAKADTSAVDVLAKQIRSAQVTVVAAPNSPKEEKRAYYTNILKLLAEGRRKNQVPPFLLVIEDAEDIPVETLEEVLSLKDGVAAILITSNPGALGGKILSKMGSQIVGRTLVPEDLAFLKNVTEKTEEPLSSLHAGEWVINGLNIIYPMKVHVKDPSSTVKVNG